MTAVSIDHSLRVLETRRRSIVDGLRIRTGFALAISLSSTLVAFPAAADVVVERAVLRNGVLHVEGRTEEPTALVTLEGQFTKRSDSDGWFSFRVTYRPEDCLVDLRVENRTQAIRLDRCTYAADRDAITPLVNTPGGDPLDPLFRAPRIVDPTMGDPSHAFQDKKLKLEPWIAR